MSNAKKQLEDVGAVIGYQPNLNYEKEKQHKEVSITFESDINYSSIVNQIEQLSPVTLIKNLDHSIDTIKKLVTRLTDAFNNNEWSKYNQISSLINAIEGGNQDYVEEFVNQHSSQITGSIIPEIIKDIIDVSKLLNEAKKEISNLYFGEEFIVIKEAEDKIKDYLTNIKENESAGKDEKNNYPIMAYDSILNSSLNVINSNILKECILLTDSVFNVDNSSASINQKEFIIKMYNEINEAINTRKQLHQAQQNVEIMKKTLYNYYEKRQNLIMLYDLLSKSPESIYVGQKIQFAQNELVRAIKNVNKIFVGSQVYLQEIQKLEKEKLILSNIYATFNHNS